MANYFDEMGWTPLGEGETPNHHLHMARLLRDFGMYDELGENERLPPPASKSVVESLPQVDLSSDDAQCTICLKKFEKGEMAKVLPCTHGFHPPCILPWLGKTSTCPLCRHELKTDDEEYEEYKRAKIREKQREQDINTLHNSMFS